MKKIHLNVLNARIVRQRHTIDSLRADLALSQNLTQQYHDLLCASTDKLTAMERNATGNAVLVSKDGWSRPVTLPERCETLTTREVGLPYGGTSSVEVRLFDTTAAKDGFGRTIFKEVT